MMTIGVYMKIKRVHREGGSCPSKWICTDFCGFTVTDIKTMGVQWDIRGLHRQTLTVETKPTFHKVKYYDKKRDNKPQIV